MSGAWCCLVLWAFMGAPRGQLVRRCWPMRRDRFAAYCRRLPAHPAEGPSAQRSVTCWTWRSEYEWAKDEETRMDSGGGF